MAECPLIDLGKSGMRIKNPETAERVSAVLDPNPENIANVLRARQPEAMTRTGVQTTVGKASMFPTAVGSEISNNLILQWGEHRAQEAMAATDSVLNRHMLGRDIQGSRQVIGRAPMATDSIKGLIKTVFGRDPAELGEVTRLLADQNGKGWLTDPNQIKNGMSYEARNLAVKIHALTKELGEQLNQSLSALGRGTINLRDGYFSTSTTGRYVWQGATRDGTPIHLNADSAPDIVSAIKQLEKQGVDIAKRGNITTTKQIAQSNAFERALFPDLANRVDNYLITPNNAITMAHVGGEVGGKYAIKNFENNIHRLSNFAASSRLESKIMELGNKEYKGGEPIAKAFPNELTGLALRAKRMAGFDFSNFKLGQAVTALDEGLQDAIVKATGATSKAAQLAEHGLFSATINNLTKTMSAIKIAGNIVPQMVGNVFQPVLFGPSHVGYLVHKYGITAAKAVSHLASATGEIFAGTKEARDFVQRMTDAGELFHAPVDISRELMGKTSSKIEQIAAPLYHLISRGEDLNRVSAAYGTYKMLKEGGVNEESAFSAALYDAGNYVPSSKAINKGALAETIAGKNQRGAMTAMRGWMVHGFGQMIRTIAQAKGDKGAQAFALLAGSMVANGLTGNAPVAVVDSVIETINDLDMKNLSGQKISFPTVKDLIAADTRLAGWFNTITGDSHLSDRYSDAMKFGILGLAGYDPARSAAAPGITAPIGFPPGLTWGYDVAKALGKVTSDIVKTGQPDLTSSADLAKLMTPTFMGNILNAVTQKEMGSPEFNNRVGNATGRNYSLSDIGQMAGIETARNSITGAQQRVARNTEQDLKNLADSLSTKIAEAIAIGDNAHAQAWIDQYKQEVMHSDMDSKLLIMQGLEQQVMKKVQAAKMTSEQKDYTSGDATRIIAREMAKGKIK